MRLQIILYCVVGVAMILAIFVLYFEINSNPKGPSSNLENNTISQNLTSNAGAQVTLAGNVEQIISDCAPPLPGSQQHCVLFKVIVLHATNSHSYALTNINFSSQLQNRQLLVSGFLTMPSKTNMTFITGDINIIKYTILQNNQTNGK
jgi:hypothetical protein